MNNQEIKENKKIDRKAYMRNYMRIYNEHRKKRKVLLTDEEKKERLKQSHKKYYNKYKTTILNKQKEKNKYKQIERLKNKLKSLEV